MIGGRVESLVIPVPVRREGKFLVFARTDDRFKHMAWSIRTYRGDMYMGEIAWSPSWNAYGLYLPATAYITWWNRQSLAEVDAFLKERGQQFGRFV